MDPTLPVMKPGPLDVSNDRPTPGLGKVVWYEGAAHAWPAVPASNPITRTAAGKRLFLSSDTIAFVMSVSFI
jgi:hypothetical protein